MTGSRGRLHVHLFVAAGAITWFMLAITLQVTGTVSRQAAGVGTALAAALAAGLSVRRWHATRSGGRLAWAILATAGLSGSVGSFVMATNADRSTALAGPVDLGRLAPSLLLAVGVCAVALGQGGAGHRARTASDLGLSILATLLVGCVGPLEQVVQTAQQAHVSVVGAAAIPFADDVAVGAAIYAAVSAGVAAHHGRTRRLSLPGSLVLLLAATSMLVGDVAIGLHPAWTGSLLDGGWQGAAFAGWLLVALTANLGSVAASPSGARAEVPMRAPMLAALSPQSLLAVPLLAGAIWLATGHTLPRLPSACLLGVVTLLGLRHALVQKDNIALNRHLEDRVLARTEDVSRSERRFRSLVAHSSDAMLLLDNDFVVTWASPSLRSVFALEPSEVVGSSVTDLLRMGETAAVVAELGTLAETPYASRRISFAVQSGLGRWHETETVATSLLADPDVAGMVLNIRDVSERQELEEQLLHQAFHDGLTRLANRALFLERVGEVLEASATGVGSGAGAGRCAVLLLDLDGFKAVNDSLGHETGDNLLIAVANRLIATVRDGDTVARLGGDEFAIVAPTLTDQSEATALAARIVRVLDRPVAMGERELPVRCSVGVVWVEFEETLPSTEDLLRNADLAMYRAKAAGGGWALFEPSMHASLVERVQEESDLRDALERGELTVAYQPTVELVSSRIVGVEALLRWTHPLRGPVSPEQFVKTMENTGVIVAIGEWVLEQACRQALTWSDPSLTVAVNVSAIQLQRSDFSATVERVLELTGLPAHRLVLELTESVLLDRPEQTLIQLEGIRARGTRVAIDDFGTGFCSLSYLARFPVDILKVDRSFVDGLSSGPGHDSALVRTIVQLSHSLDLETVAEGIEDQEQLDALRAMGCSHGQGFYFAKPLTAQALTALIEATARIGAQPTAPVSALSVLV